MKTILVPVDFSDSSYNAAKYAASLANDFSAKIHLLNVFHIPNPLQTLPIELVVTLDELEDATHSKLKQLSGKLTSLLEYPENLTFSSRNGSSTKEILDHADFIHADLIVMGFKGTGNIRDKIIGSTAYSVVRNASTPVLLIPADCSFTPFETAVIAVDINGFRSEREISILKEFHSRYGTKYEITHSIIEENSLEKESVIQQTEMKMYEIPHHYYFPTNKEPEAGILNISTASQADILIVTPHYHNYLSRMIGNDTVINLIRRSEIPVLAFH